MEQENKEIPKHFEEPTSEIAATEVAPSLETEGFIVEQPMTVEEKQELTEQLSEQTEIAPIAEEVKAAVQERDIAQSEVDVTHEHLQGDSGEIKDSGDAYEIINDLMNSGS